MEIKLTNNQCKKISKILKFRFLPKVEFDKTEDYQNQFDEFNAFLNDKISFESFLQELYFEESSFDLMLSDFVKAKNTAEAMNEISLESGAK